MCNNPSHDNTCIYSYNTSPYENTTFLAILLEILLSYLTSEYIAFGFMCVKVVRANFLVITITMRDIRKPEVLFCGKCENHLSVIFNRCGYQKTSNKNTNALRSFYFVIHLRCISTLKTFNEKWWNRCVV